MGHGPEKKGSKKNGSKHLQARVSFLYQSSLYFSTLQQRENRNYDGATKLDLKQTAHVEDSHTTDKQANVLTSKTPTTTNHISQRGEGSVQSQSFGRYFVSHLRSVSRKSQIRLSHEVKRSLCKKCNSVLLEGTSADSRLHNASRGGKKRWADVRILRCNSCGAEKRFPIGATKQPRKSKRATKDTLMDGSEDP